MKHSDENPLLTALLADEKLAVLRRASLEQGLNTLRRVRRGRTMARVGMLALAPVLLFVAFTLHKPARERDSRTILAAIPEANLAGASAKKPSVKMLSDEELFALFPGRSLALIGKPGHQQLVFLDTMAGR